MKYSVLLQVDTGEHPVGTFYTFVQANTVSTAVEIAQMQYVDTLEYVEENDKLLEEFPALLVLEGWHTDHSWEAFDV